MSSVYLVKNQQGYFATKQKAWECGRDPKLLFKTAHKDEAINMVFELSSKDISLRAEVIAVEQNDKNLPIVEVTAPPVVKEADITLAIDNTSAAPPETIDPAA